MCQFWCLCNLLKFLTESIKLFKNIKKLYDFIINSYKVFNNILKFNNLDILSIRLSVYMVYENPYSVINFFFNYSARSLLI